MGTFDQPVLYRWGPIRGRLTWDGLTWGRFDLHLWGVYFFALGSRTVNKKYGIKLLDSFLLLKQLRPYLERRQIGIYKTT